MKRTPSNSELEPQHLDLIREVIDNTLENAAKAMGDMLRIRVNADLMEFGEDRFLRISELDTLGEFRVQIMKVALHGEIGGAFYFVINGHEIELINRVSMPQANLNPSTHSESRQLKQGLMTEIENMIAALTTAEIAESLGVEVLGGVPEISMLQGKEANAFLYKESVALDAKFHVKSVLTGVAVNISPYFIWMLDDQFRQTLKLNVVS